MSELTQQPPPRKRGAKPGYYPDPLGGQRSRWWDGANWTTQLGPQVAPGAPKGTAVTTPTKVCKHCGAQSETFATTCPSCGKSYGLSRGAVIAIVAGSIAAGVLFIGGCGALIAVGVNEAEEEVDDTTITRAQFESIPIGTSRDEVEQRLGDYWDEQREESVGGDRLRCIYYNEEDSSFFDEDREYGFCFIAGKLVSKTTPEYEPPS